MTVEQAMKLGVWYGDIRGGWERSFLALSPSPSVSPGGCNDRIDAIFADARSLYADALEMLETGKVRNAAEKAWGATKRATDALILARTGEEPERTPDTSTALRRLASQYPDIRPARLVARYYTRQGLLHGDCFYLGICEPLDDTERRIRETARYIQDAERLAGVETR